MSDKKPIKCVVCGPAVSFSTMAAYKQHLEAKHHEPSIAEQMIDAERDRAMGEPIEDWLADMLP